MSEVAASGRKMLKGSGITAKDTDDKVCMGVIIKLCSFRKGELWAS